MFSERVGRVITNFSTLILAVVLVIVVATAPTPADARVEGLAEKVRCPQCLVSVADSSSEIARDMKRQIEERVAQGWSDRQILDEFAAAYSDVILLDPRPSPTTIALYVIPVAALAAGILAAVNRRRRRPSPPPGRVSVEEA